MKEQGPTLIKAARPGVRHVRIRVDYEASIEGGALRFWDGYFITDNQVTYLSNRVEYEASIEGRALLFGMATSLLISR